MSRRFQGEVEEFWGEAPPTTKESFNPSGITPKGVERSPLCVWDNRLFDSPLCKNWPYLAQLTLEPSFGIAKTESGPSGSAG